MSRWIVAVVVAVVLVLGGLIYLRSSVSTDARKVTRTTPSVDQASAPTLSNDISRTNSPTTNSTQDIQPPSTRRSYVINVCGTGTVNVDEGSSKAWEKYSAGAAKLATERWQSALLASKDVRAQAVGLVLQGAMTTSDALEAIDDNSCKDQDEACKQRLATARKAVLARGAPESIGALAQLATATLDPAVYAIAAHACKIYQDAPLRGACDQLSMDQWTRIDSDNAVPWFMLAIQANLKKDATAEADAYERATKTHRLDWYSHSLYAFSQPVLPDDLSPMDRFSLAVTMLGVQAAQPQPRPSVTQYCKAPEVVADGKRRDLCNSLAELFIAKAKTMLDIRIGLQIGRQTGWSEEKVVALTQERDALKQALMNLDKIVEPSNPLEFFQCDAMQRRDDYYVQLSRLGEIGVARDAIKKSGASIP